MLAPVVMLLGLDHTSAVAGSLLLNLEAPFTILLALIVFGEFLDRRAKAAAALIIGAAAVLGVGPGTVAADAIGLASLATACLLWAIG